MTTMEFLGRVGRRTVLPLLLIVCSPPFVVLVAYTLTRGGGSVLDTYRTATVAEILRWAAPAPRAVASVVGFVLFEAILLLALPGRTVYGPVSPGGNRPAYRDNGFAAWAVTHATFYAAAYPLGWFSPTFLYDELGGLVATSSAMALLACVGLYVSGRLTHGGPDAQASGNFVYDFFMGIDRHPRIGPIQVKQLANDRVAMMSWSLIVWSAAAKAHARSGHVDAGMWVVVLLQMIYVAKFFTWERGYFATLDVQHERMGFYILWGVLGWLPVVYPSAALYLVTHPTNLPVGVAIALVLAGLFALWINHDADHQRQRVRMKDGQTTVWGKAPHIIVARYRGTDGEMKSNILLASGWWGLARHFHYVSEVGLAIIWTLPCGFRHPLAYVYPAYLAILLFHRSRRDDRRCLEKYGGDWKEYCALVPYRIVPGWF
jgi:7-dehydrocholesterol reductase